MRYRDVRRTRASLGQPGSRFTESLSQRNKAGSDKAGYSVTDLHTPPPLNITHKHTKTERVRDTRREAGREGQRENLLKGSGPWRKHVAQDTPFR